MSTKRKRRPILIVRALLAVVAAVLSMVVFATHWGALFELRVLDRWFELRGARRPPSDAVIVAMDEESYRNLGLPLNSPWPRATHAKLLRILAGMGVKRVVFDVLFLDPGSDDAVDRELAQAMSEIEVVIGADQVKDELGTVSPHAGVTQTSTLMPHEPFAESASRIALVGMSEIHGMVRTFFPWRDPSLPPLAAAAAGLGDPVLYPDERSLLNHYGPRNAVPHLPYYLVLTDPEAADRLLRDKIVFVGLLNRTSLGYDEKDAYLTSFGDEGRVFGIELHATAALNLIERSWIRRMPFGVEAALVGVQSFIASIVALSAPPLWGAIALLVLTLSWCGAAFLAFSSGSFLPGAVGIFLVAPAAYLSSTLISYLHVKRKQRKMKQAFELYISDEMANQIVEGDEMPKLGGERVVATAMFTDIAGFTDLCETAEPESLASVLNSYFTELVEEVFKERGTLVKFIGDAVFALWGAPVRCGDHAERACRAALAAQKRLAAFNEQGTFEPLATRIGIHTGPMVVGNFGSFRRFDYTAIGDSVNLASRVEGANKYFGSSTMITEPVYGSLSPEMRRHAFPVCTLQVVGKERGVPVFMLSTDPFDPELAARWNEALDDFACRRWDRALDGISAVAERERRVRKAAEYLTGLIRSYMAAEPPVEFSGAVALTSK